MTKTTNEQWGFIIIKQDQHGVLIGVDNGDTQYLTTEEYETFLKNRNENNTHR